MQRAVTTALAEDADRGGLLVLLDRVPARVRGIVLMCTAVLIFSVLDTTAKYVITTSQLPLPQIVWLRFTSQAVIMLALMGLLSLPRLMRSSKSHIQLLRSLLFLGSTVMNFIALQYLRLDQTVTISFMMPLLVALLGGPLLGEWIGWRRMLAIGVGFIGILVVVRPGVSDVHPAVLLSLAGTCCYALYNIATRYLASWDAPEVTLFWGLIVAVLATTPQAFANWVWPADGLVWMLIAFMGLAGGFGHYLLIIAHRHAPAGILAPFSYLGLLSITGLGYAVFGQLPDVWTLAGGVIIIGSGLYLLHRERVRRLEKSAAHARSLA